MSVDNKAVVRRLVDDVLKGGNLSLIEELVAPDYVPHDPSNPQRPGGIEGMKAFVGAIKTGLNPFDYAVEDLIAEGDLVVYRWTMKGVHSGSFMGLQPTGNPIQVTGMDMFRLAGGKIVESWVAVDALGMFQQLGVLPPLGGPG